MNGHHKARRPGDRWGRDNSRGRGLENSLRLSAPFDFDAVEGLAAIESAGELCKVLNAGVTRRVWQIVSDVLQTLADLPQREFKVFVMHDVEGKSLREIGKALEVTHRAAGQILTRARGNIARSIQWIPKEEPVAQGVEEVAAPDGNPGPPFSEGTCVPETV